ncbi:MAG: hypothetical protein JXR96_19850 [Deltaproteobacteria bacterium]|nr:hypothetical protein [Deltaproteobacteria bacterium]
MKRCSAALVPRCPAWYTASMGEDAAIQTLPSQDPRSVWIPSIFGLTICLVVVATTLSLHIKADDIWWHLKTGEYILTNWSLPDQNIFSFTAPEHAWLPHEWASEVVFYAVYTWFGHKALIALGIVLNAIACALIYGLTVRYSRSPFLSALITVLATLMMLGNFSLRPYLFGNLFFIFTLHAMEEPSAGGRLRPVFVFLLFTAWANFHGSFIIGLALILLYMVASFTAQIRARRRSFAPLKSLAIDLGVAVVACTFTPHHIFGLIFPFTYLQNAFSGKMTYLTNISEWQSAGFSTPLGRMITFYILFCLFAIAGSGVMPSPIHVGLLVAFSVFAYTTIRNIPLLGIAATPVLARHLPRALGRAWKRLLGRTPIFGLTERLHDNSIRIERRARKLLLPVLTFAALLLVFSLPASCGVSYARLTGIRDMADLSPAFYPRGLLARIQQRGSQQRVFQYFNWGGAFIWALYPGQRVFIDQRNDCYPMEVFLDYFAVHELEGGWRGVLDRWQIDTVAYPPDEPLARKLRQEPGWTVDYEDDQSVLFARRLAPPPPREE